MAYTVRFYKGVPFDREYKDPLRFYNDWARQQFLNTYLEGTQTFEAKWVINDKSIDVDYFAGLLDCNYICVVDGSTENQFKNQYYWINNFNPINGIVYNLPLTIDIWNSFVLSGYDNLIQPNERPTFYPSKIVQATEGLFDLTGYDIDVDMPSTHFLAPEINLLIPTLENKYTIVMKILMSEINPASTTNPSLLVFFSATSLSDISYYYSVFLATNQILTADSGTYLNFDVTDIWILPLQSTTVFPTTLSCTLRIDSTLPQDFTAYYTVNGNYAAETFLTNNFTAFEPSAKISIGTYTYNSDINLYGKTLAMMNTRITIERQDNTLSLRLLADNLNLDLLPRFSLPIYGDEYLTYINQNKATLDVANAQRAANSFLKVAGSGIALAGGIASGNPLITTSGAIGLSGSAAAGIFGELSHQAMLEDMRNKPITTDTGYQEGWINAARGFVFFLQIPANAQEILDATNKRGYLFDKWDTFDILFTTTRNFHFIRTENMHMTFNGPQEYIDIIKECFNRGIRIWWQNYLQE